MEDRRGVEPRTDVLQTSDWPIVLRSERWCSERDSNSHSRVRSAASLSQGRSEMERMTGLEPAFARWQRAVLPIGRHPRGAGDPTRTGIAGLEDQSPTIGRHQHDFFFWLFSCQRPPTNLATAAEVESAARRFGGDSMPTHSRPNWSRASESNRASEGTGPARSQIDTARTGGPGDTRDPNLRHTRAAFCRLNYRSTNWRARRYSRPQPPRYECGVLPLELQAREHHGGDEENRTPVNSVTSCRPATERHPRIELRSGCGEEIRTPVGGVMSAVPGH